MDNIKGGLHKAPVPAGGVVAPGRDLKQEPHLLLEEIQGDLLLGHTKQAESLVFFEIADAAKFKDFLKNLHVTNALEVFRRRGEELVRATGKPAPAQRYAIAFTFEGLRRLGAARIDELGKNTAVRPFVQGLAARAGARLNDTDPQGWIVGKSGQPLHGVLIVTFADRIDAETEVKNLFPVAEEEASGWRRLKVLAGISRPDAMGGHEHFGFLDGVSQPGLRGCVDAAQTEPLTLNERPEEPDQGLPGQDLLWPGEFIFGYEAQVRGGSEFTEKGEVKHPPLPWMRDGAFLVIRRLTQLVPEMHDGVATVARQAGLDAAKLEAQLVGRWPSGAPILLRQDKDDPALGKDENGNNEFEFGDDREGRICPWAAHIRKSYARDDVAGDLSPDEEDGDVDEAEAETQTRRMLRRGIQFGAELTAEEDRERKTKQDRGLLFKCYVTDIRRQFEQVQRKLCNHVDFGQGGAGIDPIIGQAEGGGTRPLLGAGAVGYKPKLDFAQWVFMTGGGYFFAPSLSFLKAISER